MQKLNRRKLLAAAAAAPLAGPAGLASGDPVRERVVDAVDRLLADPERARPVFTLALMMGGGFPTAAAANEFLEAHWGPDPEDRVPGAADPLLAAASRAERQESEFRAAQAAAPDPVEIPSGELTPEQLDEILASFDYDNPKDFGPSDEPYFYAYVHPERVERHPERGVTVTLRVIPWLKPGGVQEVLYDDENRVATQRRELGLA